MNETAALISDLLIKLAGDLVPPQLLTTMRPGFWHAELWRQLETAGITAAPLSESVGGASLTFPTLAPILKLTGTLALPVPLAEHLLTTLVLLEFGIQIPSSGILTLVSSLDNGHLLSKVDVGGSLYVSGIINNVLWGNKVDFVLTTVDHETAVLLPRGELARVDHGVDGEPRATYEYHRVKCVAVANAVTIESRVDIWGALIRTLQMVGALERVQELTVAYANTRVQFNKALIKFQAIQQMLARLASQIAVANAAVGLAMKSLEHKDISLFVGIAKSRTSEAAGIAAALAHQIHGAIGFTQEYELHLYTSRLWAWREECGNERYWNSMLAAAVIAEDPECLWTRVTENDQYAD